MALLGGLFQLMQSLIKILSSIKRSLCPVEASKETERLLLLVQDHIL